MSSTPLKYNDVLINIENERLSLTDMWRAAGADDSKRPAEWLRHAHTVEFIDFIAAKNVGIDHLYETRAGRGGGTWAHWQIALAYAKYLSPSFHAWGNTVIRGYFQQGALITLPDQPVRKEENNVTTTRISLVERQGTRLVQLGKITEEQAADAVTLAIKQELGIDFTSLPSLSYTKSSTAVVLDETHLSTPIVDVSGYVSAETAGESIRAVITEHKQRQTNGSNRKFNANISTKGLARVFAATVRALNLHPLKAKDYNPPMDVGARMEGLVIVVNKQSAERDSRGVRVKNNPVAKFSQKCIDLVRAYLTKAAPVQLVLPN